MRLIVGVIVKNLCVGRFFVPARYFRPNREKPVLKSTKLKSCLRFSIFQRILVTLVFILAVGIYQ